VSGGSLGPLGGSWLDASPSPAVRPPTFKTQRLVIMILSFGFFATTDFPRQILGPFPAGSVVRHIEVSAVQDGAGTTPGVLLSVAQHQGVPENTEAGHAGGIQQFSQIGTTSHVVGSAPNTAPAIRVGSATFGSVAASLPLDVRFDDPGYLTVEVGCADAGQTISGAAGIDVLWPSDDPQLEIALSRPDTIKPPTPAGRAARAPRVLRRTSAPMPQQSFGKGKPRPAPTAPFGK